MASLGFRTIDEMVDRPYSPRGDGNTTKDALSTISNVLELIAPIPREGTETNHKKWRRNPPVFALIAPIPREGTETAYPS